MNTEASDTILNSDTRFIERAFNKDGSSNVERTGLNPLASYNLYHKVVSLTWPQFLLFVLFLYLSLNSLFGTVFYVLPMAEFSDSIADLNNNHWLRMFFVSVQSLTNIEYGQAHPVGITVNLIRTTESLIGLLFFALITSLLYGRFSKPTATLFYSDKIIVSQQGNACIYNIRLANAKLSQLIEAKAQLIIALNESVHGAIERKFHYVDLINDSVAFLNSSWTISHLANTESPLYNLDMADLQNKNAEFILLIKAIDDTYATEVHTRVSYKYSDIVWNSEFKSITKFNNGKTYTDIRLVGDYKKL